MNEQVVEFVIRDRKFVFKIPYNDYVPFKEAEEKGHVWYGNVRQYGPKNKGISGKIK